MTAALRCHEVSVRHDQDHPPVLSGVSLEVEPGERVALLGLNGSGKTSLLASIVGLVPHQGEIAVAGQRLDRRSAGSVRRRVGFLFNVPEDQLLFPEVIEDVAFGLLSSGVEAKVALEHAARVLERLGMGELAHLPLHHLSHGQKLRVALAGALVTEPPLLLLDEPTAGLDPLGRRALASLLRDLPAAQLVATHELDFVDVVCTRVVLLEGGTIAANTRTTREIRDRWGLRG